MDVERAATKEETIKTSDTKASVPPAASSGKYIPPALRAAAAAAAESSGVVEVKGEQSVEQQKLRRQSQGLINRLGDSNIDAILTDFEGLYRTYRRADVTSTITRIILDTISSRSNLVDTFVVLYAAFVAAVHKAIGVEFGASFVQTLVEELVSHYEKLKKMDAEVEQMEEEDQPTKGKECLNLTVLVCHLYNLQVIACPLVYDLVKMFLGEGSGDNLSGNAGNGQSSKKSGVGMIETDVELLLKVVRCSGSQLRHDDPSSLKSIIQLTQDRVNSSSSPSNGKPTKLSSRSKFMLERLNDLKNNRSAKAIGNDSADPSSTVGQALTRMKKYLGGMGKKRTIRNHEPLRVTLKDLKDADKKGKWWLVGAAWTGHAEEDLEKAEGMTRFLPMSAATAKKGGALGGGASDEQAELFELAKKQGMNTEARRNVFVTLLSSEDYVDAAQKLLALRMNEVQRREIIRVLLHCLGSEKVYNPYYVLIGQQVCKDSHGMKVTLQYCLWDFLREIGEKEVGGRSMASRLDDGANEGEDSDEDDQDDEVKARKTNPRRIANLARAYGWWMAKGSITLNALKTINFTEVRSRGVTFLQLMIVNTILSTQTNSPVAQTLKPPKGSSGDEGSSSGQLKPLESVLLKGTSGNQELCKGLLLFCQRYLDRNHLKSLVGKERGVEFTLTRLEWGIQVMKDVLVIGSSSSFPSP
ncbi:ARM repeat-containing protein [Violaceomyces palustris]|uniref:ARM repeat-containing protein n=1 Tax=Violaceomyces palustris TaxID=1673888 RepID=A0ACD0NWP4_9BASI|nr:ARM repeat-containing protein [Violaceomyces palustris]